MRRLFLLAFLLPAAPAWGQQIDVSQGGPITVTAEGGLEWRQNEQQVIARGGARAVRGTVTVDADRLIAYYRKKPTAAPEKPAEPKTGVSLGADASDSSGNEIYRVEAAGRVLIHTPSDRAQGDRAVYDMDQAVLQMTGRNLKLTTPSDELTARDSLEYWTQKRMAVARGDAVVVTKDGKRLAADTLVAYTAESASKPPVAQASTKPPDKPAAPDDLPAASGKLQKVEAFGNVSIRTATEIVTGDRGVYVPDTGIARLAGRVRITRGQNQLNGSEAEVNLKTGVSRLISGPQERVQGLVMPNDATNRNADNPLEQGQSPSRTGGRR